MIAYNSDECGEKVNELFKLLKSIIRKQKHNTTLNHQNQDTSENVRVIPYHPSKNWTPY